MYGQAQSSLHDIAAKVLGLPEDEVLASASRTSFVGLGGTSLRAVDLAARAEASGVALDLVALLGDEPLSAVLARATPVRRATTPAAATAERCRPLRADELSMLTDDLSGDSTRYHLLFSADLRGTVDRGRLVEAVQTLTDRHEALRTVFSREAGQYQARVAPTWRARVLHQDLSVPEGADGVAVVHAALGTSSASLLRPFEQPPVVFVLTRVHDRRYVLSLVIHHAVADGWSIGRLWLELFDLYTTPQAETDLPPAVGTTLGPGHEALLARRLRELAGAPTVVEVPSDLRRPSEPDHRGARVVVELDAETAAACTSAAETYGVTRNTLLLAAWSLALMTATGSRDLLLGLSWVGRARESDRRHLGLATKLLPVRMTGPEDADASAFVRSAGESVRAAVGAREVPFAALVKGLHVQPAPDRNSLIQVAFAAHDEMVPETLLLPDCEIDFHEGHCGGSVFDVMLYVQRWDEQPRLCLEYATSVMALHDASRLIATFRAALSALTTAPEGATTVYDLPDLEVERQGPSTAWPQEQGLWQMVEQAAREHASSPAVVEPGRPALVYEDLVEAVEAQARALSEAGVGTGDVVFIGLDRSIEEITSVLAVLRVGAAYVGIEPDLPDQVLRHMIDVAQPTAAIASAQRAEALARLGEPLPVLQPLDPFEPAGQPSAEGSRPIDADADRIAYVAFTSGTTGTPKAARIPHRAVIRLVRDEAVVRPRAAARFLRLAALSFDASTLEIFVPLTRGGTLVVCADRYPTPTSLGQLLSTQAVTGLWLTAGVFRLMAEHAPTAFHAVDQLLTGGDVVPAPQARRVLELNPGLRLTNGYGPTENTTFTTVQHLDDPAEVGDTVPIGTPISGTGVVLLDSRGRPTPEGAVGEIHASGHGLAADYLADPVETARRFVHRANGRRYYRTGDLARWDGAGRLHFQGRSDDQIKIRGFRVEPDGVARTLRRLPGVRDAVVVKSAEDAGEPRLLAGVVPSRAGLDAETLRAQAARDLADFSVPSLWAITPSLPLTANGKIDAKALTKLALAESTAEGTPAPSTSPVADADLEEVEDTIAEIWEAVLATGDFGYDDRFFDVGGSSLLVPMVCDRLRAAYPGCQIKVIDLFRQPTITELAAMLHERMAAS
ncbi:non-ribosomal peptide synthetase [Kitasatospora cineracea]